MGFDLKQVKGLCERVYNSKGKEVAVEDGQDIKELCNRVFGDGTVTPNISLVHDFNNVIVQVADQIAKPTATDLLGLFANFKTAKPGEIVLNEIPRNFKTKVIWSALGTGVDLVRVDGKRKVPATPKNFSAGFYYEPLDLVQDSISNFQTLVDDVANAKVRLYTKQTTKLMDALISSGKIPASNVKAGNNLTLADYNKIASTMARYGGRPVFVADVLLIDHFARQQATDTTIKNILTENIKADILETLCPTAIGRTVAVNLINPFLDENNNRVELPVNVGYMFAGTVSQKPFSIVEYGGMTQDTERDIEDKRIKMVISQEASVDLLFPEVVSRIKEDAAVAL